MQRRLAGSIQTLHEGVILFQQACGLQHGQTSAICNLSKCTRRKAAFYSHCLRSTDCIVLSSFDGEEEQAAAHRRRWMKMSGEWRVVSGERDLMFI